MPLINDIATAQRYVKLMFTNEDASLADIASAEYNFIVPVLGQDLYQVLLDEQDETGSDYADLIEFARRVVGPLAYWQDLPTIQTVITGSGVVTMESSNMAASHQWEFNKLEEALANKGCQALEQMLQHLFDNQEYYDWSIPAEYTCTFLTGKQFNRYFPLFQPYRTFERLRPLVKQVEDLHIRKSIGDGFFEYLRDKTDPGAEETIAVELIRKAVASLTIKTAIEVLPVKISPHGFTVILDRTNEKVTDGEMQAPNTQMSLMYKSVIKSGEQFLVDLKSYLDKTATDEIFGDYKNSDYYTAPVVVTPCENPNSKRNMYRF